VFLATSVVANHRIATINVKILYTCSRYAYDY